MDDYVSLVLSASSQAGNLLPILSLMLLCLGRIFPIIILSPFLGAKILPHPVKVALGISLWVIFLPTLVTTITEPISFNHYLLLLLAKELIVGLTIGTLVSVPFFVAQSAGMIIDHQRGGASLMTNDPAVQNQSSPMGTLFNYMTILIFYMIDGPFILFDAIIQSYEIVPPDRLLNGAMFSPESPFYQTFITLLNRMMVLSVQLASPGLITILMTDLFLGIVNRMAPQVQITFLGMPLKSFLAMIVIWIGWYVINDQIVTESHLALNEIKSFIKTLIPT